MDPTRNVSAAMASERSPTGVAVAGIECHSMGHVQLLRCLSSATTRANVRSSIDSL